MPLFSKRYVYIAALWFCNLIPRQKKTPSSPLDRTTANSVMLCWFWGLKKTI